jgi:gas vesicle structural protein
MAIQREIADASFVDVLDRVLDKGIVIDTWIRVFLSGIELITIESRIVVASIQTYLERAGELGTIKAASWPSVGSRDRCQPISKTTAAGTT